MDQIWLASPSPALRLWPGHGGATWRLNAAAMAWSRGAQWTEASWRLVAEELAQAHGTGSARDGQVGGGALRWRSLPMNTGWLVWLTPEAAATAATDPWKGPADKLALVQGVGRMGFFERDLRTGERRWDPHMFPLFGLDPAQGVPSLEAALACVHPDDRRHVEAECKRALAMPGRHAFRCRVAAAGDRWRDLHTCMDVRADVAGTEPTLVRGVVIDDTESVGRLREQQAISAQFAKALRLAEISVWRIDLQRRRVHVSDPVQNVDSTGDPAGLPLADLRTMAHPDDLPALARAARQALRTSAVVDVEARYPMRDASGVRHMLTRRVVERDEHGRAIGLLGVALDQTERIAERERAEALARRIDMVADAAAVGIWFSDLETGRTEWNRQMFLIHGMLPHADAPDFAVYVARLVHPEEREALLAARDTSLQTGESRFDTEFRVVHPDGSVHWIEYRSRRDDKDGRVVIVGTALDATARIGNRLLAERSLREKGAVERANAARAEFLAKMSHELRTPLNAVLGFAQLMEHDGASVPAHVQLDRIVHIRQAGEQLLALVGDVLEHLRQEAPTAVGPGASADGTGNPPAAPDGPRFRALSVLYIEDNPVNVILVEELVGMRPHTTLRCAVNGLAGVAEAHAVRPDVVLVDMQLPDIDGFEVLRRLRADRSLDGSAIIALSANGMSDDIARALAAGFDDYWTKPIDFRHFLQGLDTLARARQLTADSTFASC